MEYTVVLTQEAQINLKSIQQYIDTGLRAPQAAANTISTLRDAILNLNCFPKRYPLSNMPSLTGQDIRVMPIANYRVLYYVNVQKFEVTILQIVYQNVHLN